MMPINPMNIQADNNMGRGVIPGPRTETGTKPVTASFSFQFTPLAERRENDTTSLSHLSMVRAEAGRAGGMSTSAAKAAAARANGKLGGRPRKRPKATS